MPESVTVPETFVVERTIAIAARPETVFRYFVEPERLLRWMGTECVLEPAPSGVYRLQVTPDSLMVGEFVQVDPPRFVSFTWGWEGAGQSVPPGGSLVEVSLEPDGEGTVLTLRHSGLPSQEAKALHNHGWEHFLERLALAAAGGDPGPDPWAKGEFE